MSCVRTCVSSLSRTPPRFGPSSSGSPVCQVTPPCARGSARAGHAERGPRRPRWTGLARAAIAGLLLAALALSGCGPSRSDPPGNHNDNHNDNDNDNDNDNQARDAGLDAAVGDAAMGDAATDGGLPDAGEILAWDAGGSTAWQVKAVNPYLLTDPVRLAAHPSAAATLAALPAATEAEPNMVVYTTSDGLTWLPETIMSFTGSAGFFGTPLGLAYDPQAPTYLVAALEPVPPPSSGLAVVLAWSGDGGSSFSHPWDPWTQPWPPDDMRYVDGSPAELVWRAGASFFFESAHGTSFARSETLSPLPAGCSAVTGFDLPRDDHDTVAIWCTGGDAHQCDLLTGACTALPIGGAVRALRYAPGDPSVIYALTTDRIWRSADGGVSFNEAHVFSADQLAISAGNAQVACALDRGSHELRCTRDGGQTWMDLTPPLLQGPDPSEVLTLAFSADGSLWAVAHPGVIQHPAP